MSAKELSYADVMQFIEITNGTFSVNQAKEFLNIVTPQGKTNLYKILSRMVEAETLDRMAVPGTYRKRQTKKILIDWESADLNGNLPLQFPFNLHTLCKIYPKSIIIIAGSKNEGKTAFLMECIKLNYPQFDIDFFNSETGPEQLKARFESLEIPHPAPFRTYECYDHFSDLIDPTRLSIIDYLDFNAEVYRVGEEIDNIFRKLTTGASIIGIQKPPPSVNIYKGKKQIVDRDLGYGGGFSSKRASLYISMSNHKLKIVYCKTPMQSKVNPNNMTWAYNIDDNGFFKDIKRHYETTDEDNNV